jgi:hypothetical protein
VSVALVEREEVLEREEPLVENPEAE